VSKKRLDSWKAIAVFLGRSLRTVQRWHEINGLPVHHFGGNKGSVFAYEEEIDHWLMNLAEEPGTTPVRFGKTADLGRQLSHEQCMAADALWETRSERNIHAIADQYRKAIDNHTENAAAYTGLANAMVYCALNEIVDGALAYPTAVEALRRIPQMDREPPDAKCPAAWIDLLYNRNWRQARAGFESVADAVPSSFALSGLTAMDIAEGRMKEARENAWKAWRLNPLVSSLGAMLCWTAYLDGDFQQVLDLATQIRSGGGGGPMLASVEALALVQSGSIATHVRQLENTAQEFGQNHTLQGILGYAYGSLGELTKAREKRAYMVHCSETKTKSNGYALALVSMGMNSNQEAISWLEAAYAEGSLWSLGLGADPMLERFKGDLRFERLVAKIGATVECMADGRFEARSSKVYLEGRVV
jgi:tetratricopeptide (TPR) repeat protein